MPLQRAQSYLVVFVFCFCFLFVCFILFLFVCLFVLFCFFCLFRKSISPNSFYSERSFLQKFLFPPNFQRLYNCAGVGEMTFWNKKPLREMTFRNKNRSEKIIVGISTSIVRMGWGGWCAGSIRDVTGFFFLRGQSNFSWFFPCVKCFFPVENFHFGRPKTNFSGFEKWERKKKKKKKRVLSSFCNFSTFPFTIFLLFFSIFHTFSFFPCLFFPGRSAEISRSEVGGGHSARLLRHWVP